MTPKMTQVLERLEKAQAQVAKLEAQFNELKRAEINKVEVRENISSVTLVFNGRAINSRQNPTRRGFRVVEGGKILKSDYRGNLKDLCFDLATGRI